MIDSKLLKQMTVIAALIGGVSGLVTAIVGNVFQLFTARSVAKINADYQRRLVADSARLQRRAQRVNSSLGAAAKLFGLASTAYTEFSVYGQSETKVGPSPSDRIGVEAAEPLAVLRVHSAYDPEVARAATAFIDGWIYFVELDRSLPKQRFLVASHHVIDSLSGAYAELAKAVDNYIEAP